MAGGIALSIVPSTYQLGIVFHAGVPEGAVTALETTGDWVAARTAPSLAGSPFANAWANTERLTYSRASPFLAPGNGTKLKTFVGPAPSADPGLDESSAMTFSPLAGAKASTYTSALTWR